MDRVRYYLDRGCHCERPVVTSAILLGNRCLMCGRDRDPSILSYAQWKTTQSAKATRQ
jgi:hypothetical protein